MRFLLLVDVSGSPQDNTNVRGPFKASPLEYVGPVSGGKCVPETESLLEKCFPLCKARFDDILGTNPRANNTQILSMFLVNWENSRHNEDPFFTT